MLIKDIVRVKGTGSAHGSDVISITPETPVHEVAKLMATKKIGLVVVCNKDGALAGVISERDLVRGIGTIGKDVLDQEVGSIMTEAVRTCRLGDHTHDVMASMTSGGFRHMPVVEKGKLKGLVSSTDIFKHLTERASSEEQAMLWAKISWA